MAEMSVELIDYMGSDLSVVNAARVSFDKESDWEYSDYGGQAHRILGLSGKDTKLIYYLAKHKHKSPFNHAFLSFRVKAPLVIARQLVKHEYLPWNEVSRRYVDSEPEFYIPKQWRKKADNVKQGSSEEVVEDLDLSLVYETFNTAYDSYQSLLDSGVAAEQARMVLPQAMMTEWIWSGSLYAFMKMCKLRLDPHTQKETREVAERVFKEIESLFPVSAKALLEYAE